jgi:apolipoprotein N-acyltransferase
MQLAKLNDVTAKSMIWLAIIIFFVGMMIASPSGRFFSTIVAMLVALVPLFFNRSKKRIIAGIIVAAAAFFAYATFGECDFSRAFPHLVFTTIPPGRALLN